MLFNVKVNCDKVKQRCAE